MKEKVLISVMAIVLLFAVGVQTAHADIIKLYPTDDSYVDSINPNTNYGAVYLKVGFDTTAPATRIWTAYLRFDLTGIDCDKICGATLWLYCEGFWGGPMPLDVDAHKTTDDWDENTINWNNKPAYGDWIATTVVGLTLQYYSWDGDAMKNYVIAECKKDGIVSIVIKSKVEEVGDRGRLFDSKEWPDKPYLEIVLMPQCVPEFDVSVVTITSMATVLMLALKRLRIRGK